MSDKKNPELTRVKNFIEKQKEVDLSNIHEVADNYRHLHEIQDLIKKEMGKLKNVLVENKAEEYFPEEEMKVLFQEGKPRYELDNGVVVEELGVDGFTKVASVSETSIKKLYDEQIANKVIGLAKRNIGKTSDTISVRKMTKQELKEMN
jgi:hypothetical protein